MGLNKENQSRILAHAGLWESLHLDVVLVQETSVKAEHYRRGGCLHAALCTDSPHLRKGAWKCLWAHTQQDTPSIGGTAIFIRRKLIANQSIKIDRIYDTRPQPLPAGTNEHVAKAYQASRLIAVRIKWGGHVLQLASAYLPSGDVTGQKAMINTRLHALLQESYADGAMQVWGGDWNFVMHQTQDRMSQHFDHTGQATRRVLPNPHAGSTDTAGLTASHACMSQQCPDLVDAYRHMHPHGTSLTYFSCKTIRNNTLPDRPMTSKTLSASRLDRFYVAQALLPYVLQCKVPTHASTSDHRVVRLDLLSRTVKERGPGLTRCRVYYGKHPDLRQSMDTWLEEQLQAMPAAERHQDVLDWWNAFKFKFQDKIKEVGQEAKRRWADALIPPDELRRAVDAAAAAVMQGLEPSLTRYTRAVCTWQSAVTRRARACTSARMRTWVHEGERPNPAMSRIMQPRKDSTCMAGLRAPGSGTLVSGDREMANIMVRYWADISKAPVTIPAAEAEVLDALRTRCTKFEASDAQRAGSETITAEEVRKAMKGMKPNSAPGVDGIPLEAFRLHKQATSQLLARLFTAMGTSGMLPADFHLGAITFIFKSGNKSDPANYRPITLLNTDYRILTRILAMRLGPVMGKVIGREQSAYMPGRRIGEAVWLLQLMPHMLRLQWRQAAVCFMDFKKAYDTVSRQFLFAAMEAMEAGTGMLKWARMLLGGTHAVAMVNGWMSTPLEFHAGVRQGCPLSPLLYLFIAQALLSWLQTKGYGIDVAGHGTSNLPHKVTAVQYADDCSAFLNSLDLLPAFNADMGTFRLATNQELNAKKTYVMRIGLWDANSPQPPGNLPFDIVSSAVTLGVRLSNERPSQAELQSFWHPHVETAEHCLKKICKLGLSVFGRAFATTGYALSSLLYRAEFMGFPMQYRRGSAGKQLTDEFKHLKARIASVVDKNRFKTNGLTGFSAERAVGKPQDGGTGLMPLEEHVNARLAWWGVQLLTAPQRDGPYPPWILVARAIINEARPGATPLVLLAQRQYMPASLVSEDAWEPTSRLMLSLQPQGTPLLAPASALLPAELGDSINYLPIWFNPLLKDSQGRLLDASPFLTMCKRACWGNTVGDLALARKNRAQAAKLISDRKEVAYAQVRALQPPHMLVPQDSALEASHLLDVGNVFTREWWDACDRGADSMHSPPHPLTGEKLVVEKLKLPSAPETPLAKLRVRQLTAAQPAPGKGPRDARKCAFIAEAVPSQQADQLASANSLLKRMWAVPAPNAFKEDMWRMCLDGMQWMGLAKYSGTRVEGAPASTAEGKPCMCERGTVSRTHIYWACPVARAVYEEMQSALAPYVQRLQMRHVWLAEPPHATIKQHIWDVVVLAAVKAMTSARRYLIKMCLPQVPSHSRSSRSRRVICDSSDSGSSASGSGRAAPQQQQRPQRPATQAPATAQRSQHSQRHQQQAPRTQPQPAQQFPLSASLAQVELAQGYARENFWALLQNFALTYDGRCPQAWIKHGVTDASHPFFHVKNIGTSAVPRLQLHLTRRPTPPT